MRNNLIALLASGTFLLIGLYAVHGQGSGAGYYCDGPIRPCTPQCCVIYSGYCLDDEDELVDYTAYTTTLQKLLLRLRHDEVQLLPNAVLTEFVPNPIL